MTSCEGQLFASIVNNDLDHVRSLLRSDLLIGVDLQDPSASLATALHLGTIWGHLGVVRMILKHPGTNVNLVDENGSTPFAVACSHGQADIVRELLKIVTVDVNARTSYGATPLSLAAYFDHLDVVREMVSSDRDLDVAARVPSMWSEDVKAVEIARRRGHLEIATLLEDFETNPAWVRFSIKKELGYAGESPLQPPHFNLPGWAVPSLCLTHIHPFRPLRACGGRVFCPYGALQRWLLLPPASSVRVESEAVPPHRLTASP